MDRYGRYFLEQPRAIENDHIPFLDLGIPALDIIDLHYGRFNFYWHSQFDALDKCSAASLQVVGEVLITALRKIEVRSEANANGTL